jgi:two-component sensor histidine kinase
VAKPHRRGFGTRLIERSATTGLGGAAILDFGATGLVCKIEFPLRDGEA